MVHIAAHGLGTLGTPFLGLISQEVKPEQQSDHGRETCYGYFDVRAVTLVIGT